MIVHIDNCSGLRCASMDAIPESDQNSATTTVMTDYAETGAVLNGIGFHSVNGNDSMVMENEQISFVEKKENSFVNGTKLQDVVNVERLLINGNAEKTVEYSVVNGKVPVLHVEENKENSFNIENGSNAEKEDKNSLNNENGFNALEMQVDANGHAESSNVKLNKDLPSEGINNSKCSTSASISAAAGECSRAVVKLYDIGGCSRSSIKLASDGTVCRSKMGVKRQKPEVENSFDVSDESPSSTHGKNK